MKDISKRETFVIGLTGGVGSGKSTVSAMFRKLGARVVDADVIAREIVQPGRPAWKEIKKTFGASESNAHFSKEKNGRSRD